MHSVMHLPCIQSCCGKNFCDIFIRTIQWVQQKFAQIPWSRPLVLELRLPPYSHAHPPSILAKYLGPGTGRVDTLPAAHERYGYFYSLAPCMGLMPLLSPVSDLQTSHFDNIVPKGNVAFQAPTCFRVWNTFLIKVTRSLQVKANFPSRSSCDFCRRATRIHRDPRGSKLAGKVTNF